MNTYLATISNGKVFLENNLELPDNTKVLLTILDDIKVSNNAKRKSLPEGITFSEISEAYSPLNSLPDNPVEFQRKIRDEEW